MDGVKLLERLNPLKVEAPDIAICQVKWQYLPSQMGTSAKVEISSALAG